MRHGQRERIGGMARVWGFRHGEGGPHHVHDLFFAGAARANNRLFDRHWAVLEDWNLELRGGEQDHPGSLTNFEGVRGLAFVKILGFNRHRLGFVDLEHSTHNPVEHRKALRHLEAGTGFDQFAMHEFWGFALFAHHTNAEVGESRVDADDNHAQSIPSDGQDCSNRIARDGLAC
jgi:hypothetical protein